MTCLFKENSDCPWSFWRCKNGQCLHLDMVCNGHRECNDGSDEHTCGEIKFAMYLICAYLFLQRYLFDLTCVE